MPEPAGGPAVNRQLSPDELTKANELLGYIRERIDALSGGDANLRFAYVRKIARGMFAECGEPLPPRYTALDRLNARGWIHGSYHAANSPRPAAPPGGTQKNPRL
jgi:hypothetical protein